MKDYIPSNHVLRFKQICPLPVGGHCLEGSSMKITFNTLVWDFKFSKTHNSNAISSIQVVYELEVWGWVCEWIIGN